MNLGRLPISARLAVAGVSLVLFGTLFPLGPPPDPPPAVVPLLLNGEPSTRINLAVLAEGYTESELDRFISDAEGLVEYLFAQDPFFEYAAFFNAFAVPVASAESGSDHPTRGIFRDTYFNSSFGSWGLPHGLTIPPNDFDPDAANGFGKARDLLDLVLPEYDLIVIVVNDGEYGGWGDRRGAVTSVHARANDILTHEMGHAFADLGDEYTHPFPNDPEPVREEAGDHTRCCGV